MQIGISAQHLCDLLAGRRSPAGATLKFLGLEDAGKMYRKLEGA